MVGGVLFAMLHLGIGRSATDAKDLMVTMHLRVTRSFRRDLKIASAITCKTMTDLLLEGYELLKKSDPMKGVPRKS